jgi:hypothetical protein
MHWFHINIYIICWRRRSKKKREEATYHKMKTKLQPNLTTTTNSFSLSPTNGQISRCCSLISSKFSLK